MPRPESAAGPETARPPGLAPAEIDRFSTQVDRRLMDMAGLCRSERPLPKTKARGVLAALVGLIADAEAFRAEVEAVL